MDSYFLRNELESIGFKKQGENVQISRNTSIYGAANIESQINYVFMAKETESSKLALKYLLDLNIKPVRAVIRKQDEILRKLCEDNNILMCNEEELLTQCQSGNVDIDYILSFYWKRVGYNLLQFPARGSINFHPGPLPEARGSGYHMAILETWGYWGVTAHYMEKEFDTGSIIECRRFPISKKIVNKDLVEVTHKKLFQLFKDIINWIIEGKELKAIPQQEGRYFGLKELEDMKLVGNTEGSEEIDRKIRAFWNPPYSGAQIELQGKRYTLINEEILKWIAERLND